MTQLNTRQKTHKELSEAERERHGGEEASTSTSAAARGHCGDLYRPGRTTTAARHSPARSARHGAVAMPELASRLLDTHVHMHTSTQRRRTRLTRTHDATLISHVRITANKRVQLVRAADVALSSSTSMGLDFRCGRCGVIVHMANKLCAQVRSRRLHCNSPHDCHNLILTISR